MNAFAVIPWTLSPRSVVNTVTPVANIPSVRRNAIAGSPSSPLPSSSSSADGRTSNEAPNASGAEIAPADRDLELLRGGAAFHHADCDGEGAAERPLPKPGSDRVHLLLEERRRPLRPASVGVSSRQCGVSLSCTIRRKRNRIREMARTEKPMIFSFVPP